MIAAAHGGSWTIVFIGAAAGFLVGYMKSSGDASKRMANGILGLIAGLLIVGAMGFVIGLFNNPSIDQ